MDSLINDIQEKVAKYVTCSEAIHNAVILARNQTIADVLKIVDDGCMCIHHEKIYEEIKNLKDKNQEVAE